MTRERVDGLDSALWDDLEREAHSLMCYGPGRWDCGWGVYPTPREAVQAMRIDQCRETHVVAGVDGLIHCRRPSGHAGDHRGYSDGSTVVEWAALGVLPAQEGTDDN